MKSHELFRELLKNCNAKQLSAQMGLSSSIVYKWGQPVTEGGSGAPNPLDRLEQLMQATDGHAIAQWICEQAGGFYVKNPEIKHKTARSVVKATNKIVQEFAAMLSLVASVAVDSSVTEKESAEIRKRWEEVKSVTEFYVRCCERGEFRELHAEAGKVKEVEAKADSKS